MILYLLCGIPGSGKSYYAQNTLKNKHQYSIYISRDAIRFCMVPEDKEYFSKEDEVYDEFVREIKAAFSNSLADAVIADATHLNWASRNKLLTALGLRAGEFPDMSVIPIVFNTSLNTCLERNENRKGRARVPKSVIRRMNYQMTDPKNDPYKYEAIIYVAE
jgi:predicted kinase